MSTIEKTLKLERLHKLIQRKFVGNTDDYAMKLNISRSSLFNYIDELRLAGAQIEYCRSINCFVYLNTFVFELIIKSETLSKKEMETLYGGFTKKIDSVHFFRL